MMLTPMSLGRETLPTYVDDLEPFLAKLGSLIWQEDVDIVLCSVVGLVNVDLDPWARSVRSICRRAANGMIEREHSGRSSTVQSSQ